MVEIFHDGKRIACHELFRVLSHKHQLSPHDYVGGNLGFTYLGYTKEDGGISQNDAAAMVSVEQVQGLEF